MIFSSRDTEDHVADLSRFEKRFRSTKNDLVCDELAKTKESGELVRWATRSLLQAKGATSLPSGETWSALIKGRSLSNETQLWSRGEARDGSDG